MQCKVQTSTSGAVWCSVSCLRTLCGLHRSLWIRTAFAWHSDVIGLQMWPPKDADPELRHSNRRSRWGRKEGGKAEHQKHKQATAAPWQTVYVGRRSRMMKGLNKYRRQELFMSSVNPEVNSELFKLSNVVKWCHIVRLVMKVTEVTPTKR